MKFTKMHGLGNDYVYVNVFEGCIDDLPGLARAVSDRHTGIGSDGLILIYPSDSADVRMEIYNADGSRAQMCGNGIRGVAKYVVEHGFVAGPEVRIDTDAGIKIAQCHVADGTVCSVRVDMGKPLLAASTLPSTVAADSIVDYPFVIAGATYHITCVSIGNPHAVVFVDDLEAVALSCLGPPLERAPIFPEGVNAHFAHVDSPTHVTLKTWERGSGATRACGTGACAVCVAGVVTRRTKRSIIATLPGGDLTVDWADDDHLYLTGPTVEVFTGEWLG